MSIRIEIDQINVSYNTSHSVLNNASVIFPSGQFSAIIGPNGSGKSTLLHSIVGLIKPKSGIILFNELEIDAVRDKIAYVPQRESVDWNFPTTVYDVVAMGRLNPKKWWKRLSVTDKKAIENALKLVNLLDFSTRQIGQLSGGQQQRVFIARALAQEATLFLLDEPFSGVDFASQETLLELLTQLVQEGKTVIMVHHDMLTVKETVDWVALVHNGMITSGPTQEIMESHILQRTFGWIK